MSDQPCEWKFPGGRWWKFDFHTHTPASRDYGSGTKQEEFRRITPTDWLLSYMRAEIDCVAVTDHNSGEWIDRLKQSLHELDRHPPEDYRPLCIFPGVEITANGGIHILALFGPDKGSTDVTKLLGAVNYRGAGGETDTAADLSPIDVVEAIGESGGIPILAHVDQDAGAWGLSGNTLSRLLEYDGLLVIEVVDRNSTKPDLYNQRKLSWSEVVGSDSHHPEGFPGKRFPGSHFTWIKMAKPSLEGLRLALLDGQGFSIRRSDESGTFDPFKVPEHFVESIEISDAQYMGRGNSALLQFNPWLNALIGGRGTGKSTVIHALRIVAKRERDLEGFEDNAEPRVTFERFNQVPRDRTDKGGISDSTEITWKLSRNDVRYRVRWQKTPDRLSIDEDEGAGIWKASRIQTLTADRFPIRIFSQGQIAALAVENQQALLQVIDDAAGVADVNRKLEESRNSFFSLRTRIRELSKTLEGRDQILVDLQDVERKLEHFEQAGHTDVLTAYRHRTRQHREVNRQFEVAEVFVENIEKTAESLLPEDLPDNLFLSDSTEDVEVVKILNEVSTAIRAAASELQASAQHLKQKLETNKSKLEKSAWKSALDSAITNYDSLIETLREEGVTDPNEHGRLVQERQRLEGELTRLQSVKEERDRLSTQLRIGLDDILKHRRAICDIRDSFLRSVLAQNDFVRIRNNPYGDEPRVIEQSLRNTLNVLDDRFQDDILTIDDDGSNAEGIVAELLAAGDDPDVRRSLIEKRIADLKSRIEDACNGRGAFGGHFNNYLAREFKKNPSFLDRLLTWFPEDSLNVEYSRRGDGTDFRPIVQASSGQRSAAMLAFLLAHGEEPLILDQPEDDLDNHLIYDLVVRQIRQNKLRRQIIVVTHNPNIVVNGDAEMLHVLDFRKGQCVVADSGSLQDESIREEVCRVMEGGREAFERRYRRLGPEPSHV